jgi:hypothetical protein
VVDRLDSRMAVAATPAVRAATTLRRAVLMVFVLL